jgi:hypothetical protein
VAALITVEHPLTVGERKRIADFADGNRLPAIYGLREFVSAGGLMAYGANLADLYRRAAGYAPTKFSEVPNPQNTLALLKPEISR